MDDERISMSRAELKELVRELMQEIAAENHEPVRKTLSSQLEPGIRTLLQLAYSRSLHPALSHSETVTRSRQIFYTPTATADLGRLTKELALKLRHKIENIAHYAHMVEHQALHHDWPGFFQMGTGEHRVIYSLPAGAVLMVEIIRTRQELFLQIE